MVALALFHIPLKYDFSKAEIFPRSTPYITSQCHIPLYGIFSIAVLFHDTAMCSVVHDASYITKDFKPNTRYFTQVYQHKNKLSYKN